MIRSNVECHLYSLPFLITVRWVSPCDASWDRCWLYEPLYCYVTPKCHPYSLAILNTTCVQPWPHCRIQLFSFLHTWSEYDRYLIYRINSCSIFLVCVSIFRGRHDNVRSCVHNKMWITFWRNLVFYARRVYLAQIGVIPLWYASSRNVSSVFSWLITCQLTNITFSLICFATLIRNISTSTEAEWVLALQLCEIGMATGEEMVAEILDCMCRVAAECHK